MKKLLFILSLFFIITSCNKTPIITLSVDKEVISADGKEFVTFKVVSTDKHNNEEDVTNDCQIFFTDSKLELGSTTFSTTSLRDVGTGSGKEPIFENLSAMSCRRLISLSISGMSVSSG